MSQDNIFREVDEELRGDRMRALWRRLAPFVLGAALAVVAAVAFNEGWNWYHSNNAARSSDELYAAFELADGDDLAGAQAQLDALTANGSGSYPVLAEFRKAGVLARQGNTAEAVAAYDALANGQSNSHLRELALVLAGTLLVDTGSVADVESRVGSIAVEGSALRNAAREALGLAQYKAGDFAAAQQQFEAVVNDPQSQASVRNRMSYYLGQMRSEGAIAAEESTEAEAAAGAIDAIVSPEAPAPETTASDAPVQNAPVPAAPAAAPTPNEPAAP